MYRHRPTHNRGGPDESGTAEITAFCGADRCRQRLAADCRRAIRGGGEVRRGQRTPDLRRFFQRTAQGMVGRPDKPRHRSLPATRLYQGRTSSTSRWSSTRWTCCTVDGSTAFAWYLRTAISRGLPRAFANRARTSRLRCPENAGELSASLPPLHLHRESGARGTGGQFRRGTEVQVTAAAQRRDPDSWKRRFPRLKARMGGSGSIPWDRCW